MAFCCEMKDGIRIKLAKGALHCLDIGDVGLEKPMPRRIHDLGQRRPTTGIGQLVDREHVVTGSDGATDHGGADEARTPRHNQSHLAPPGHRRPAGDGSTSDEIRMAWYLSFV